MKTEKKLLPFEHTGNKSSDILLIFLHGFPDGINLWESNSQLISNFLKETISGLNKEDAQFLAISYPNYHCSEKLKLGIGFPDLVKRIKHTIDFIDDGKNLKKILVTHDWGAAIGYMYDGAYPGTIQDMVALDIGGEIDLKSLKTVIPICMYQWTFIFAFIIGLFPIFGNFLGTLISRIYMKIFFKMTPRSDYNCSWNYMYFYLWLGKLINAIKRKPQKKYEPSSSQVFIYGSKKPFMFHTEEWIKKVQGMKDSEVHGVDSGHWIMREKLDFLVDKIKQRIRRISKL